ncbi:hypothetical protein KHS38_10525 [Mucilaginibacter sp. Bleaf8]|uniref:hypothetical protein n=1 Tax=Mucilaginibacter sp. Bleaf8 TaxID=2834430 RepID=UPI001BCC48DB|nr:hypothetical protein [Mucilaginibacter sp. Bleaf8]MBS7564840.1 hypothetical protein [Mucilaginibacter sp. Bleaf8]
MFKKRNTISKLWLKYTNRHQYKIYKWELDNYKNEQITQFFTGIDILDTSEKIIKQAQQDGCLNVMHSGNAGDVIYALPTVKKLHEITKVPINLYLRTNQPLVLSGYASHSMGAVMLNEKTVSLLTPLLNSQEYITSCTIYNDQKIHINFDIVRSKTISLGSGNIARWYSYFTGVTPELWKQWLKVEPDTTYANTIVLARSERYRNSAINYSFLKEYKNLIFIGVKSEYEDMKKQIPDLIWTEVNDFLILARILAGCKLFIGNQSFPYSVAEALKVPRILEVYAKIANVVPEGENAHDFYFQHHLEGLVKELYFRQA